MNGELRKRIRKIEEERARLALEPDPASPILNRFERTFPDDGPYRRELYQKHLLFFREGAQEMDRCFMAGNRVGKTRAGDYEMTCHLTGNYPHWWEGRRFEEAGEYWAAGETAQTTRDIVQAELFGRPGDPIGLGTGMIPRKNIVQVCWKRGLPGAIDFAQIRHASGRLSTVQFKSYSQGRTSFQGTAKQGIWIDEECPDDVFDECLTRLLTTQGIIWLTFTPLKGLTELVLRFMPSPKIESPA